MAISRLFQGISGGRNLGFGKTAGPNPQPRINRSPSTRPVDWLALPNPPSGSNALYGLFAVHNGDSNFLALSAGGAYTVDWGDGFVENFTSGATANHNYVWSNVSSATLTSEGFRQVIVKVYAQGGQTLSNVNLQVRHTSYGTGTGGNSQSPSAPWLDIVIQGASLGYFIIGGTTVRLNQLRYFRLLSTLSSAQNWNSQFSGCSALQTVSWPSNLLLSGATFLFSNCHSLVSVPSFKVQSGQSLASTFSNCHSLVTAPWIDTIGVTGFSSMFNNCYSLQSVPLYDTSSATLTSNMFTNCYSLETVPAFNFSSSTNLSSMFFGCTSLKSVPLFPLRTSGGTVNMNSMFQSCTALLTVPLFNTSAVNSMNSTFYLCSSLQSVPLFNTQAVTNMSQMFRQCSSLRSVPLFNTQAVTNMSFMFTQCNSLQSVPLFNTGAVTDMSSMLGSCHSLQSVPLFNTQNVTSMGGMFNGCKLLQSIPLFNTIKVTDMSQLVIGCDSLQVLPQLDMGVVNFTTNMNAGTLYSLQRHDLIPTLSHDVSFGKLSATELNRIYTSLPNRLARAASSASGTGSVVTYTTTVAHGYIKGMVVSVTGFTSTGYNLTSVKITSVPSATTFTVASTVTGASSGTGTVTPAALTLTVTGNWGTATDTITTATNKGWTVTG
jgi:surface protein